MDEIRMLLKDMLHKIQDIPDIPCEYVIECRKFRHLKSILRLKSVIFIIFQLTQ